MIKNKEKRPPRLVSQTIIPFINLEKKSIRHLRCRISNLFFKKLPKSQNSTDGPPALFLPKRLGGPRALWRVHFGHFLDPKKSSTLCVQLKKWSKMGSKMGSRRVQNRPILSQNLQKSPKIMIFPRFCMFFPEFPRFPRNVQNVQKYPKIMIF